MIIWIILRLPSASIFSLWNTWTQLPRSPVRNRPAKTRGVPRSARWSQLERFKSRPEIIDGLGCLRSHPSGWPDSFFLNEFSQPTPKNKWCAIFEGIRQKLRSWGFPMFGEAMKLITTHPVPSCEVDTVSGKGEDYWWKPSQFTEALYWKVMDQTFCDCKHQQAWTLLLAAQRTSWAWCLRRL